MPGGASFAPALRAFPERSTVTVTGVGPKTDAVIPDVAKSLNFRCIVSGGTGGPADSTMFYTMYLYQKGFAELDMGYAAAMAWGLVVIIGAFTAVNFIASKWWVFYDD